MSETFLDYARNHILYDGIELLEMMAKQGLPKGFARTGVELKYNFDTKLVYLTNEYQQVALKNGDRLMMYYQCPECQDDRIISEAEDAYNSPFESFCKECHPDSLVYLQKKPVVNG